MSLLDICEEIIDIEEGLMTGSISFSYDPLMSALNVGHPMMILDGILAEIYFDAVNGVTPELSSVKNVYSNLHSFKEAFNVPELTKPLQELETYIVRQENLSKK